MFDGDVDDMASIPGSRCRNEKVAGPAGRENYDCSQITRPVSEASFSMGDFIKSN